MIQIMYAHHADATVTRSCDVPGLQEICVLTMLVVQPHELAYIERCVHVLRA